MLKIYFKIRDMDKKVIAGASLKMFVRYDNGEVWQSDLQIADNSGTIWLEIENEIVNRITRDNVSFEIHDIRHGNKLLEHTFSRSSEINFDVFKILITVQSVNQPEFDIDDVLDIETLPPITKQPGFQVSGQVMHANGHPAAGLVVIAFDRIVCEEKILGSDKTEKEGGYKITYSPADFADSEKSLADLIVRVYQNENPDAEPMVSSPLILRAKEHEIVNLAVGDEVFFGLTLYEHVTEKLAKYVKGKFDCIESTDIWYLADKTGLSTSVIAQYVKSNSLLLDLDIKQDKSKTTMLFFSLLRSGILLEKETFANVSDQQIRQAVVQAIDAHWIVDLDYSPLFSRIRTSRVEILLNQDTVSETLMTLAGIPKEKMAVLHELTLINEDNGDDLLKQLAGKPGFNGKRVETLQNTLATYQFVGRNLDIVQSLQTQHKIQKPEDLVGLDEEDWNKILLPIAEKLPLSVSGRDASERATSLAKTLNRQVEQKYPSQFFVRRGLADSELALKSLKSFFKKYPEFDFAGETARQHVGEIKTGTEQKQLAAFENIESLFHVLPNEGRFEKFKLLQTGFNNAIEIAAISKTQFRDAYAKELGGIGIADKIYANAKHVNAKNVVLAANFKTLKTTVASSLTGNETTTSSRSSFPALGALFGDVTASDCEHCRSATSPSAYLVDLLSYLKRAFDENGNDGLSLLRGKLGNIEGFRRPDIELLELSCANSETSMPYIDLVLEVLENVVEQQMDNVYQTVLSVEEIAAQPEHTNYAAYGKVLTAVYPWNLPFNIDLEMSRAYLKQMGLPLYSLLADLHEEGGAITAIANKLSATEYLGLSIAQAILVVTPAKNVPNRSITQALKLYWGLVGQESLSDLNKLSFILRKSNLEKDVFEAIFATEFVNPAGTIVIDSQGKLQNTNNDFYDRFHRFARLHIYSGLAIDDLDIALISMDATQLLAINLISNLASIFRVVKEAKLTVTEVTGWWTNTLQDSLYNFSESIGVDYIDVGRFSELTGIVPDKPVTAWQFWYAWTEFQQTDLIVGDIYNLLTIPEQGSLFSVTESELILEAVQASLVAVEQISGSGNTVDAIESSTLLEQRKLIVQGVISENCGINQDLIAAFFEEIPQSLATEIFNTLLADEFITATIDSSLINQFSVVWKQMALAEWLDIFPADFDYIAQLSPVFGWLNPGNISLSVGTLNLRFINFTSLYFHQQINVQRFTGEVTLYQVLVEAGQDAMINGLDFNDFAKLITIESEWSENDVNQLLGNDGFAFNNWKEFLKASGLLKIEKAISIAESHNLSQQALWSLSDWKNVDDIRTTLESRYEPSQWLDISAQIHNPLREKQRDALLGYLTPRVSAIFRRDVDVYDVYAFYLIDPEMSSCFITSRIKQAIASVQQYIQRILLNLEGTLNFQDKDDLDQWLWRKNYRVWEANQKVFIYPENWLEPEFRDNKSELFTVLEDRLLQDEVRADTAQDALMEYCRSLHSIANMEIAAIYQDKDKNTDENNNTKELHVFSRTRAIPHVYYHCVRNENSVWTSWSEVKVDIEGNHLIPVKYNERMYLFWPSLIDKLDSESESYQNEMALAEKDISSAQTALDENKKALADLNDKIAEYEGLGWIYVGAIPALERARDIRIELEPTLEQALVEAYQKKDKIIKKYTYLDVNLNWSENLFSGDWSPKKVGKSTLQTKTPRYISNPEEINFSIKSMEPELEISLFSQREIFFFSFDLLRDEIGSFKLDICEEKLNVNSSSVTTYNNNKLYFSGKSGASWTGRFNQKWLIAEEDFPLYFVSEKGSQNKIIDNETQGAKFCSTPPLDEDAKDLSIFSYEDEKRVFIIDRKIDIALDSVQQNEKPDIYVNEIESFQPSLNNWEGEYFLDRNKSVVQTPVFGNFSSNVAVSNSSIMENSAIHSASMSEFNVSYFPQNVPSEFSFNDLQPTLTPANPLTFQGFFQTEDSYSFTALYHPYTCSFIRQLSRAGLEGLYYPDRQIGGDASDLYRQRAENKYFDATYNPTTQVSLEYPLENIDFSHGAPYAVYNWELFFHAPMLIAKRLMQNQKFEDAQKWLHYIFNPTANDTSFIAYWRFRPFMLEQDEINKGDYTTVEELAQLSTAEFDAQVAVWEQNPFNPHAISRLRTLAYMRNTVMTYLDNLIAWGDQLFRRDTMESLNEAAQIYLIAADILGYKPLNLPASTEQEQFNTAIDLVNGQTTIIGTSIGYGGSSGQQSSASSFIGVLLNFCIPANDKLLDYWVTVSDRLFKIRHCMNIEGVVRSLPLYEPPIDPALLVKAAASELSVADVISGLNAPRPHYRFTYMLQKSHEFLAEVKGLGSALLAALEKQDAEELSQLRNTHEVAMAKKVLEIRKEQVEEAEYSLQGLNESHFSTLHRRDHYQSLLETGELQQEIDEKKKLNIAHGFEQTAASLETLAAIFFIIPTVKLGIPPGSEFGGTHLGSAVSAASRGMRIVTSQLNFEAGQLSREASNIRRNQEWQFQINTAERDLEKLNKDILAAEIRKAITEKEIINQETQISNAEQAELFLRDKFTNKELYSWMVTQLSTLYFQTYQLAQELASAAEQCYQYELGVTGTDNRFIQFGHWDSLHKGLLVGEKLSLDLRRMELSFINKNKRQYELSKQVSMIQLSPEALIQLRETGECLLTIPENLYDFDYPGHYKRRIKSVSITIPAITGPYTTLSCTLTLMQDWIRPSADSNLNIDDIEWNMMPQAIATSGAQNDAGLFQLDFRDERYLPFEGAGAISQWKLVLPEPSLAQFDYHSMSDVIFHINYTAEEGGEIYKTEVEASLKTQLEKLTVRHTLNEDSNPLADEGLFQQLSMKHHFPDIWARMKNAPADLELSAEIDIKQEFFPYLFSGRTIELDRLDFVIISKNKQDNNAFDSEAIAQLQLLKRDASNSEQLQLLNSQESNYKLPAARFEQLQENTIGEWDVVFPYSLLEVLGDLYDIVIICKYNVHQVH